MEVILTIVSPYLTNKDFLNSLSLTTKNYMFEKRRNNILKKNSANKLCEIWEETKDCIINLNTKELLSDIKYDMSITELLKFLSSDFLNNSTLRTKHTFSPRTKIRYVKSRNLMMIDGKPTINDFYYPQINKITFAKLDPVYRMKPFQKSLLKKRYPNVKALIY